MEALYDTTLNSRLPLIRYSSQLFSVLCLCGGVYYYLILKRLNCGHAWRRSNMLVLDKICDISESPT